MVLALRCQFLLASTEVGGRSLLEVTEDAGLPLSLPWGEPSGLLILFDL